MFFLSDSYWIWISWNFCTQKGDENWNYEKKKNSKRFVLYLIAPPLIMGGLQSQISIRHYIFYKNAIKYQSDHFITLLVKLLH